jgi:hypothetical protein
VIKLYPHAYVGEEQKMSWHVLKGRYYMAYGGGAQPNTLYGISGGLGHMVVIVFDIKQGLIGTGKVCDGEESHVEVNGSKVAFVGYWDNSQAVFKSDTKGARLYFDTTAAHKALLEPIFTGQTNTLAFEAFRVITAWQASLNATITTPSTVPSGPTEIQVSATAVGVAGGTLNLTLLENEKYPTLNYQLLNAMPEFRMGGYTPDIFGATLAQVSNASGPSSWVDSLSPATGSAVDVGTFAETREFEYIGFEAPGKVPEVIKAMSWYETMSKISSYLIPDPGLVPFPIGPKPGPDPKPIDPQIITEESVPD